MASVKKRRFLLTMTAGGVGGRVNIDTDCQCVIICNILHNCYNSSVCLAYVALRMRNVCIFMYTVQSDTVGQDLNDEITHVVYTLVIRESPP